MSGESRLAGKRSRSRGYITDYRPLETTRRLLDQVIAILRDYEDYLPLTLRQVFYILVGRFAYPKEERFYGRVIEHVGNARRARRIPFWAIRDDDVSVIAPDHYRDKDEFWAKQRMEADAYRRDKLARQDHHIEVWCEAAGMVPQLAAVASDYSVPVYSCSGFDSLSAKKVLADRICKASKTAVILHCGDLDLHGEDIYRAISEDVRAFVLADRPHYRVDVEFRRVALTAEQVAKYSLPTAPPKARARENQRWGERETCQLEAMPPDITAGQLRRAIFRVLDKRTLRDDRFIEGLERPHLTRALAAPKGDAL